MRAILVGIIVGAATLMGCTQPTEETVERVGRTEFSPVYIGVETRLLEGELVNFLVQMRNARDGLDVDEYARCAAAQYTLIRGYEFARHIRTTQAKNGGIWSADAVYTISKTYPLGVATINAADVVENCKTNGIPTV